MKIVKIKKIGASVFFFLTHSFFYRCNHNFPILRRQKLIIQVFGPIRIFLGPAVERERTLENNGNI